MSDCQKKLVTKTCGRVFQKLVHALMPQGFSKVGTCINAKICEKIKVLFVYQTYVKNYPKIFLYIQLIFKQLWLSRVKRHHTWIFGVIVFLVFGHWGNSIFSIGTYIHKRSLTVVLKHAAESLHGWPLTRRGLLACLGVMQNVKRNCIIGSVTFLWHLCPLVWPNFLKGAGIILQTLFVLHYEKRLKSVYDRCVNSAKINNK